MEVDSQIVSQETYNEERDFNPDLMNDAEDDNSGFSSEDEEEEVVAVNNNRFLLTSFPLQAMRTASLEEWVLSKIACGLSKLQFQAILGLNGIELPMRVVYRKLHQWSDWSGIHNLSGINGAASDPFQVLNWMIGYYSDCNLWTLTPHMNHKLVCPIFIDGRNLWGPNLLIAFGFRNVTKGQSEAHVWPLAMVAGHPESDVEQLEAISKASNIASFRTKSSNSVNYHFL